jgi:hypothetical protein
MLIKTCRVYTKEGLSNSKLQRHHIRKTIFFPVYWYTQMYSAQTQIRTGSIRFKYIYFSWTLWGWLCLQISPLKICWIVLILLMIMESYQFKTFLNYLVGVMWNQLKNYTKYLVNTSHKVFRTRFSIVFKQIKNWHIFWGMEEYCQGLLKTKWQPIFPELDGHTLKHELNILYKIYCLNSNKNIEA